MRNHKLIVENITDQEKWATINYEVDVYLSLYQEMGKTILTDADFEIKSNKIISRALFESKCIHVRNLCEIFTGTNSADCIVLNDLVSDNWLKKNKAIITKLIDTYNPTGVINSPKKLLDKFLFHPTLNRRFQYNLTESINKTNPPIHAVINCLPDAHIPCKKKIGGFMEVIDS